MLNRETARFCSNCFNPALNEEKLGKCAACDFVRYCSKSCQRLSWKTHKSECRRLKAVFPNLPLTEVLFLSKIIDRVIFLSVNGDRFGWERERKFSSLMDHKNEIRADSDKMIHFEKIYKKMEAFRKEEMIEKDEFFDIFCKASINSYSIHTNIGTEIGIALDLGVSKYNHSCRPTCAMVFDGFRYFKYVDASDITKAFISYIDVGRSKYVRRRDLKARWYFDCECSRCTDPADDMLTAIRCTTSGCEEPLIISEVDESSDIECPRCHNVTNKNVVCEAQNLMKTLPASFDPSCPAEQLSSLLVEAERLLHPSNVYVCRLRTALFHVTGSLQTNMTAMHKQIYDTYKLCFPKADRHVGYQLLHIVKDLILDGERAKATSYALEATNIFEVCFGLDHPFYLQTLALWTFLDTNAEKTDNELISLTHFNDNRRVDIAQLLEKARMLPSEHQT
ncbi:MYND finger [Dictyocaulus viviparus]|uniref:MYND finger n=1 Tax=Dictyocaulus viviparus TaxID=29172 RepID=A0A0D8YBB2_DICVI|nr:MYND finger [Dictyocaulus viviparus]